MNLQPVKCDYCDKPSIGYADCQLQGPFFCADHQSRATKAVEDYWDMIEQDMQEHDYKEHDYESEGES